MSLVHTRTDPLESFEFLVPPRNPERRKRILAQVERKPQVKAQPKPAEPEPKQIAPVQRAKTVHEPSEYWTNTRISGSLDSFCFGQHSKEEKPGISLRQIMREVSEKYNVSIVDIKSERRTQFIVKPRQEFFYRARTETGHSLPNIAKFCGNRDHTTVLHGVRKHAERLRAQREEMAA